MFSASTPHLGAIERSIGARRRTTGYRAALERCNHYCLMCSQPPRDVDDQLKRFGQIKAALPLVDPSTKVLGFTGGEPLLDWHSFIGVLETCRDLLPITAVHVLTNGRGFARREVVSAWADVRHPSLTAGIPIYAAVVVFHDYVVQARGAFDDRTRDPEAGSWSAGRIRVVLHAITTPRIVETCRWLARNLPVRGPRRVDGAGEHRLRARQCRRALDRPAGLPRTATRTIQAKMNKTHAVAAAIEKGVGA